MKHIYLFQVTLYDRCLPTDMMALVTQWPSWKNLPMCVNLESPHVRCHYANSYTVICDVSCKRLLLQTRRGTTGLREQIPQSVFMGDAGVYYEICHFTASSSLVDSDRLCFCYKMVKQFSNIRYFEQYGVTGYIYRNSLQLFMLDCLRMSYIRFGR